MVNPFEYVILTLSSLGFFTFLLPFILTAAILYGLLRKSQIFGPPERNVAINATVAMVASFLVWAAPIIVGVSIEKELARFIVQSIVASFVLMMGILMAGMVFPPDLPGKLSDKLGGKFFAVFLVAGIIIGFAILITSGLMNVFMPEGVFGGISEDVLISIGTIFALLIIIAAIVVFVSREEKKAK